MSVITGEQIRGAATTLQRRAEPPRQASCSRPSVNPIRYQDRELQLNELRRELCHVGTVAFIKYVPADQVKATAIYVTKSGYKYGGGSAGVDRVPMEVHLRIRVNHHLVISVFPPARSPAMAVHFAALGLYSVADQYDHGENGGVANAVSDR